MKSIPLPLRLPCSLSLAFGLASYASLSLFAAGEPSSAPSEKPNIVFILADDLGWADVGFHGPDIKTPNIDKLAAGGAKLEAFYTLPVCTPSRSALMTGRYPIRYGRQYNVLRPNSKVGLSLEERLLPEALRKAGYETAICGKWHLGEFDPAYQPMQRGFEHQYRLDESKTKFTHQARSGTILRDRELCSDEGFLVDLYTAEAVRLIEHKDPNKPLFLYVAFNSPHAPLLCPPEYSAPYANLGAERSIYAGMVAHMDRGIGKIVEAIDRQGLGKNTLFIFMSDNGGVTTKSDSARNEPLRDGKGSLYDGGTRVVASATWDGKIPANSVVSEPLHMVDWYPTLLRLAGASPEQKLPLDGKDAWPTIAQGRPSPHTDILINTLGHKGAIRQGDWKLVQNGQAADEEDSKEKEPSKEPTDTFELFNLAQDPYEKNNIADQHPEKVKELSARLETYAKEAVPPILKPGPNTPASKSSE